MISHFTWKKSLHVFFFQKNKIIFACFFCIPPTLLIRDMSRCPTRVVSDTDTTQTFMFTLNYMIFSKFYRGVDMSVTVSHPLSVFVFVFQQISFCSMRVREDLLF